jgi:multiple sugar transport system permease protein
MLDTDRSAVAGKGAPLGASAAAATAHPLTRLGRALRLLGVGGALRVVVLGVVALAFIYPILGLILAPTRSIASIDLGGVAFGTLANVRYAWTQILGFDNAQFVQWFVNTTVMVGLGAIIAIVLAIPSGYAMARLRFPGRNLLVFVTLLLMVMPNTVLIIPLFLEVSAAHLLDQFWPVSVILGFYPFGVYLAYIHFRTALPVEVIEAARMDGLKETGVFLRIALPLSQQAVALVGFFSFVAGWTNFFLPYVLLPETARSTLAVGLLDLISASQLVNPEEGLNVKLYMPELALAATVSMLPVLVVFVAAQRYLQRGAMVGAVKG